MLHNTSKNLLLLVFLCLQWGWGFSQTELEPGQSIRRHKLSLNPLAFFLSYGNVAYEFRLSDRHGFGIEFMYSDNFTWITEAYPESFRNGYPGEFGDWNYADAFRLRLQHKLYSRKLQKSGFYFSFQLAFRKVSFQDARVVWPIEGPSETIYVSDRFDIQRTAMMAGFGLGQDFSFGNFSLGWFATLFGGIQQSSVEKKHPFSPPPTIDFEGPSFVGGPRLGLRLGYNFGKTISSQKGGLQ